MARESRLMLDAVVGPRTQESATELVEGAANRLAPGCWPLWSQVVPVKDHVGRTQVTFF